MNILCIGDIVGKPGRDAVRYLLEDLKTKHHLDAVIANAENSAGGSGLTVKIAKELFRAGCDVLTLGDHVWDQREIQDYLDEAENVIRPANFPEGTTPGRGWCVKTLSSGLKVGVVNMLGRTFMRYQVDCPFKKIDAILSEVAEITPIIILDFHAETTSEKVAMGHYVDGRASLVFGTHTHIQTADDKILAGQTAYITDLGMTGPYDSVIGQNKEQIIKRFLTSMPIRFSVAKEDIILHGVIVQIDEKTGKAKKIKRVQEKYEAQEN